MSYFRTVNVYPVTGVAGFETTVRTNYSNMRLNQVDIHSEISTARGAESTLADKISTLDAIADYAGGTTYAADEYVYYVGIKYRSLQGSNTGNQPNISPTYWEKIDFTAWTAEATAVVFVDATSFTVTGTDVTSRYTPGRALRMDSTSYGYVLSSTFSTNTTVNMVANISDDVPSGLALIEYGQEVANTPNNTWDTEAETVAYASTTTITVSAADVTTKYTAGLPVRMNGTEFGYIESSSFSTDPGTEFGYIESSSFSTDPDTTLTLIASESDNVPNPLNTLEIGQEIANSPFVTTVDGGTQAAALTQTLMRRGTKAAWTSADPTLAAGEWGLETDTKMFKIGDGATAWTSLQYGPEKIGPIEELGNGSVVSSSGTLTLDLSLYNNFHTTLFENVTTLTISNGPASADSGSFFLRITQDSSARSFAFTSILFDAVGLPDISTVNGIYDFMFKQPPGSTVWTAYLCASEIAAP